MSDTQDPEPSHAADLPAEDPESSTDSGAPDLDIPDDVTPDYSNAEVKSALEAFQANPDYERLAAFLTALRSGYLIADVTGTPTSKRRGRRVRTIRSTDGKLVLPLFTSMEELRAIAPESRRGEVRGIILQAREGLALIASDRFVAAEFNKASDSLVVLRKYITLAVSDREITAEMLQRQR